MALEVSVARHSSLAAKVAAAAGFTAAVVAVCHWANWAEPDGHWEERAGRGESGGRPTLVQVVSVGRSGSSFVGELLASHSPRHAYFFEPLRALKEQAPDCLESADCIAAHISQRFLCAGLGSERVRCDFSEEASKCCDNTDNKQKVKCLDEINQNKECSESSHRVIKTVRAKLRDMEQLLEHPKSDIKIVNLYRDPRGVLNSVDRIKDWKTDIRKTCSRIHDDFVSYIDLKEKYPNNVQQVAYDRFCLNMDKEIQPLLEFAFGTPEASAGVRGYLQTHTTEPRFETRTTRNSSQHFQQWRLTIRPSLLADIQSDPVCLEVILFMGHRVFKDVKEARNLSIRLL